jgi:catechol 2,3-dioxygenase-like lactoylglutathione lyase family enzyme
MADKETKSTGITLSAIDHVVLYAMNLSATVNFYTSILGMKHEVFRSPKDLSVERQALIFGSQKINLHDASAPFQPHARIPAPGTLDLCFLTEMPVEQVLEALKQAEIEVIEGGGVVSRQGARGSLKSVYIRDPDGNLVEYVEVGYQISKESREWDADTFRISNYA